MPYDPINPKSYKTPVKAAVMTQTSCKLGGCAYHEGPIRPDSEFIYCSHPHKPQHMDQPTCPLYRLDWQKQLRQNGPKP
jgi:hypothetical protein